MRNHFTKWLLAAFTIVALVGGGVAYAQEQVGAIEGVVADKDGAALPGVTVEAVSTSGAAYTAVTDADGRFMFPRLRPSVYKLTASLQGFTPAEVTGVALDLGKTLRVNFTLNPGTFEETITVTAETVVIDVTKTQVATSFTRESIDLMPKGRDFTSLVEQAAGSSNESLSGGYSIDGASGSENRFVIDGIDTTHPQDGLQGQQIITDFVDEVQVKTAGYAAEYGGSLGGVINAITKTGGNDFSGYVGAYYTDRAWGGDQRPTVYLSDPSLYRTFDKDDQTTVEPGFAIGGPIIRDNLWFFAAYQPSITSTDRTPDGSSTTFGQDDQTDYATANLKGNIGQSFLFKIAANLADRTVENNLPAQDGTTPADADLTITNDYPSQSYSLYADWVASDVFLLSARAGYYMDDNNASGFSSDTRYLFRNGDYPAPQSDPLWRPVGWSSVPAASFTGAQFDKWEREAAGADATVFFNLLGSHQVKFGFDYQNIFNSVASGEVGNYFEIRWGLPDRFGAGVQGTYGSVGVRRFGTFGDVESTNTSIFLQDSWAPIANLTINFGVRAEQEDVPNYGHGQDPTLPEYFYQWDFQDKIAPRIGFAWDVFSDQKLKVYGSWGTYYDIMKLEMPRGSFGGDRWIQFLYPLNTLDWTTLNAGCTIAVNDASTNPCPALGTPVTRDLRHPTSPEEGVDPDLQPMENREWQIGAEYLLTGNSAFGFRYVNKELINTIEDIGYLDLEGNEVYITGNPGKGVVAGDPDGDGPLPAQAEAIRDYQAFEFSYNRRFADNWMLRATYTYSELTGNYGGLASSDEYGRTDPNVARYFDGLVYGFDDQGALVTGPLSTDRPHAIEVQGLYRFNFGTSIGVNTSYRTGGSNTTNANYNGVYFYPNGRDDMERSPDLTQTDLYLAHTFKLGGFGLELSVNVLNLFDESSATWIQSLQHQEDVCDYGPGCDTTNEWYFGSLVPYNYDDLMADAVKQPNYGMPINWQAPRSIRLGAKFTF